MRNPTLLLTCEHGGNRVPEEFRALFAGQETLLAGHRGEPEISAGRNGVVERVAGRSRRFAPRGFAEPVKTRVEGGLLLSLPSRPEFRAEGLGGD